MKNCVKYFKVIAFVLVICLSILTCNQNDVNPNLPNGQLPFSGISASELVANIKIGWNLGNTLDAHNSDDKINSSASVLSLETLWGNPKTKEETITTIKKAGFNAIRIPVTWYKVINNDNVIRKDWMTRVVEIVNYAVENDMYVILNSHHDEGIFKFTNKDVEKSLITFQAIWEQIADTFKDYDEKLVFEGLNEPRTKYSTLEWNGGSGEEHKNLNRYYQVFVDAVRASGSNNENRILMVNTYAASATDTAMKGLRLPNDTVSSKIIVSIHAYEPYNFALNENGVKTWKAGNSSDEKPIKDRIDLAYNTFVSKGIPVIMGEFGALNKDNEADRAEWAKFYVKYALSRGIKCIWWDDGGNFKLLNRSSNTFYYPAILEGLMQGAASSGSP